MQPTKRILLLLAFTVLLLATQSVSAQRKFDSAIDMNDYLISFNDSLYSKGQSLGRAIVTGVKTKDFTGISLAKKHIILFANNAVAELKAVKDQFGSEEFRKGMIDFMAYEIDMMKIKTPLLDKLNEKSTKEEIQAAIDEMRAGSKDENEYLQNIGAMQVRFAEKNNFNIEQAESDE